MRNNTRWIVTAIAVAMLNAGCGGDTVDSTPAGNSPTRPGTPSNPGTQPTPGLPSNPGTPPTPGSPSNPTHPVKDLQLTRYVDPMIGTDQVPPIDPEIAKSETHPEDLLGGFTTPAASLPSGMVQWGPDTPPVPDVWSPPGYHYSQTEITGFSVTHLSGVGCSAGGALPIFPTVAGQDGPASFKHSNETAKPGYYSVTFDNGIRTELTATLRSGAARFAWPDGKSGQLNISAESTANAGDGVISLDPNDPKALQGTLTGGGFCNNGQTYTINFYIEFDKEFKSNISGDNAQLTFSSSKPVNMKVGISYVSVKNAKDNLQQESGSQTFDQLVSQADAIWNQELNAIQVTGGSDENLKKFYSSLYHALLAPSVFNDADGEYLAMDGTTAKVQAGHNHYTTFSTWDIYRSLMPMIAWLKPAAASDMMQSLVDDANVCGGSFPKWVEANTTSDVMPGDGASILVAQSYMYGATGFDTKRALSIMLDTANGVATSCNGITALPGLSDYIKYGYLPPETISNGPASTTLEYAVTDYAVFRFAQALGDDNNAAKMLMRSTNWKNLIKPSTRAHNGTTLPTLSDRTGDGKWTANSYKEVEGNVEQYTWMVPFDIPGLINILGGDSAVVPRLDMFNLFLNAGEGSQHMWIGNEPSFATPWIYNWTSRPDRTQKIVRQIVNQQYTTAASGLPGNDDEGAMSGWFVWAALGLYPEVPAVPGFTLTGPLFQHALIKLGNGNTLTIDADNPDFTYVKSATLNGAALNNTWLDLEQVRNGGALAFGLSDAPTTWGRPPVAR
jgi:predicted alpha-1,2-mannosidase